MRKFYDGGFEPMTKREAALILGVRESAAKDKVLAAQPEGDDREPLGRWRVGLYRDQDQRGKAKLLKKGGSGAPF